MNGYFINREISWLKFNKRVLDEAASPTVPVLEQLRFISIFTSNLDEFFMVRAGSLHDRSLLSNELPDNKTGMTANEQLAAVYADVGPLYAQRDIYYTDVTQRLRDYGINQADLKNLSLEHTKYIKQYFKHDIMPLVSPQVIDTKHPFPHLENKRLYILVSLKNNGKSNYGIIPISSVFNRVVFLKEPSGSKNIMTYILIEDILLHFIKDIFKQYTVVARAVVKVTRNADIEVEDTFSDDDIDYRDYVKEIIKKRERLAPVRVEIYTGAYAKNAKLLKYFMERVSLDASQCYNSITPLDMSYVGQLEDKLIYTSGVRSPLRYNILTPQPIKWISSDESVSKIVEKRDIFLSYPYYSMQTYLKLLQEAADDTDTVSIKITLYRLSNNSEVIRLLCKAAENGREVTVVVELKARFDENNNINWSKRLEEAGCHIVYGIESLKVHSKITLITRKNGENISYITHIATGNYNEKTATLYTDVGIITTNKSICNDAVNFFMNMTMGISTGEYSSLLIAPTGLKNNIIKMIRAESEKVSNGKKGYICFKMNSMTDKEIIDELAEASRLGVKIDLIIRGICCLLPGICGMTDNIRIISIVGRFLEHSRIFIFGEDEDRKVYIGSADFMTRNTTRRIEILTPIYDEKIADELYGMTRIMLKDNVKSSMLCSNGTYEHVITDAKPLDSQIYFYDEAYNS